MSTQAEGIPFIYPFSFNQQATKESRITGLQLPSDPLEEGHQGQNEGPLEKLLFGKLRMLKATVNALLEEIEHRESLHSSLVQEIREEVFRQRDQLGRLRRTLSDYTIESLRDRKGLEIKIESSVNELEGEKRKENLEVWRDLMFLKKYLMSALREYWDAVRRREILCLDQNENPT